MCIFRRPSPPPAPAPLPPAPVPPSPPPLPDELPEAEVKPVNPAIQQAQSKLGTKKGKKGSTKDLRIDKNPTTPSQTGVTSSLNVGNTNQTGGIQ
tara:strand:- start:229 stop:513 length:285 start_codon:yes stop_codon:yes gene_type:complete